MSAVLVNCTSCGQSLAESSRFCDECGTPNAAVQAAPAPAAPVAPAVPAAPVAPAAPATVRGTILRDTNAGSGLILVNGAKKTFTLEHHWQGAMAPQVQMTVDVTLDVHGEISSAVPVNTSAEDLEKVKDMAKRALDGGAPVVMAYVDRIGKPVLAAMFAVIVSWIWLPAVSVTIMAGMKQSVTLFDVLRLANAGASLENFGQMGGGSSGLYGFICVLAMFAPLLPTFLKHKYAPLGYCAPLAFLLLTGVGIYMKVHEMANAARNSMRSFGGKGMDDMADAMMQQISNALSIGFGTYLSLAAALFLAWCGAKAMLKSR